MSKSICLFSLLLSLILLSCQPTSNSSDFNSNWSLHPDIERPWAGGDYWLNPLQAWLQEDGQLKVIAAGGDRNAVLLTRKPKPGQDFQMQVDIENLALDESENAWVGFQIGLQGQFKELPDDAVHGRGLSLGLTTKGQLFIGDSTHTAQIESVDIQEFTLKLEAVAKTNNNYDLQLKLLQNDGSEQASLSRIVSDSWVDGLVALSCSQILPQSANFSTNRPHFNDVPELGKKGGGETRFAFSNWKFTGALEVLEDSSYGPILWAQYTLSDNILKMSAQLAPIGNGPRAVELEVDGQEIARENCNAPGNNALFRIENWESDKDHKYAILYTDAEGQQHRYTGQIPKNPNQEQIKVASLSCVDDVGFPHWDLTRNVAVHNADLYLFHGDQIYERVGGYGVERSSTLDYLRKWYIWGWAFRDLIRNRPVVIIPDDHDVFHGNLWGEGGKRADVSLGWGYDSQDDGGYKEPPEFVNMVHRTQTGHLPDPYDPTPVLNDISVYYTNMNYGGLSLAILGDRQWKSAPKYMFPDAAIENGWPQNTAWNPKTDAFHPDAQLLGPRQEAFLEDWVQDWAPKTVFKVVVSQSPFCNVATLPKDIYHDKYVPGLPRYKPGEYPEDDRPVADFDSNGWPQNKRNKAINTIRKAFALHVTGDQHLGSTGQYGVVENGDGNYWISSPAVSNLWPRRWYPAERASTGRSEDDPRYVGDYEDGFGNKIRVKAIANPYDLDRKPDRIFDKAPGYSIITFNKSERTMELAVWPRWAAPNRDDGASQPFPGWPITIQQQDNFGKDIAGYLPPIEVDGEELIKLYDEQSEELIYAIRPPKGSFLAKVFDAYTSYRLERFKDGVLEESLNKMKITSE